MAQVQGKREKGKSKKESEKGSKYAGVYKDCKRWQLRRVCGHPGVEEVAIFRPAAGPSPSLQSVLFPFFIFGAQTNTMVVTSLRFSPPEAEKPKAASQPM